MWKRGWLASQATTVGALWGAVVVADRVHVQLARWSETILDEVFESISRNRPDLDVAKLLRTRQQMCQAVPDCLVHNYKPLIDSIEGLPDPHDRHVVAAAIRAGAQVTVTHNVRDFPESALSDWGMEAMSPDAFVQDIDHMNGRLAHQAITEVAAARKNPPVTVKDIVDALDRAGLPVAASLLRR